MNAEGSDIPNHGLVRDGTPCGDNLVCINQTCVSIFPHIDQTKCPTNQINVECSGHGVSTTSATLLTSNISSLTLAINKVCTNVNRCYCSSGWGGPDCSISVPITTTPTTTSEIIPTQSHNMEKIEKTYGMSLKPLFCAASFATSLDLTFKKPVEILAPFDFNRRKTASIVSFYNLIFINT